MLELLEKMNDVELSVFIGSLQEQSRRCVAASTFKSGEMAAFAARTRRRCHMPQAAWKCPVCGMWHVD